MGIEILSKDTLIAQYGTRIGNLVYEGSNPNLNASKNYISPEYSYEFLSKNNLDTHGLVDTNSFIYSQRELEQAEKIRKIANENANKDNWQKSVIFGKDGKVLRDENGIIKYKTFCNYKVGDDYKSIIGEKESTEIFIFDKSYANDIGRNFENKNYGKYSSGLLAQLAANYGNLVTASYINTKKDKYGNSLSGHVATVVANYGVYDERRGPRISQAGLINGEYWLRDEKTFGNAPVNYYEMTKNNSIHIGMPFSAVKK
ncbi:hypothetical protein [Treponema parvum]|uniref:hypothetical protein n=1 Tax=Treponema parvum TaxID=138851 RepID=UPI001AEC242F|nr:hypothetical protein [Treponema parvum]QTQ17196.1 hypothetical protein HXT04_11125 [Treponema parvum]